MNERLSDPFLVDWLLRFFESLIIVGLVVNDRSIEQKFSNLVDEVDGWGLSAFAALEIGHCLVKLG